MGVRRKRERGGGDRERGGRGGSVNWDPDDLNNLNLHETIKKRQRNEGVQISMNFLLTVINQSTSSSLSSHSIFCDHKNSGCTVIQMDESDCCVFL